MKALCFFFVLLKISSQFSNVRRIGMESDSFIKINQTSYEVPDYFGIIENDSRTNSHRELKKSCLVFFFKLLPFFLRYLYEG